MKNKIKNKYSVPLIIVGVINLILFTVKLYIGVKTNSLCVYTDSINNLLDAFSATIACISAVFITLAPTKKHPFGFGRVEYVLELVMSLILTVAGAYFAYTSLARLSMPTPVWFYFNFAIILGISALVKLALAFMFLHLYKKTKSVIFKTIMLDSFLDTCVTSVALVSFSLSNSTGIVLDGFLGLAISVMIIVSGVKLIISSVSKLIGKNDLDKSNSIKNLIESKYKDVKIENILINDYGVDYKFITICAKSANGDKQSLQKLIKNEIESDKQTKVYIEWEE